MQEIQKYLSSAMEAKLGGGLVTKISRMYMFFAAVAAAVAWKASSTWLLTAVLIVAAATLMWTCNKLIHFATENPESALLEGAQFIKLETLRQAQKDGQPIDLDSSEYLEISSDSDGGLGNE